MLFPYVLKRLSPGFIYLHLLTFFELKSSKKLITKSFIDTYRHLLSFVKTCAAWTKGGQNTVATYAKGDILMKTINYEVWCFKMKNDYDIELTDAVEIETLEEAKKCVSNNTRRYFSMIIVPKNPESLAEFEKSLNNLPSAYTVRRKL